MLKVTERKTGNQAIATQLEDGRYEVDFGGGQDVKHLAESTFKRQFLVEGELTTSEVANAVNEQQEAPIEETATEQEENNSTEQADEESETVASEDEQSVEGEIAPKVEVADDLDSLLEGAEEVEEGASVEKQVEAKKEKSVAKPTAKEEEGHSTDIKLRDWLLADTRGGKTTKVTSIVQVNDYHLHITEYNGYITDVRVLEEVPASEVPENDPDATTKQVYRSPKSSLKDTLEWMGIQEDEAKWARKVITQLRKEVKNASLQS